jgi:2-amino-4-hydroxy-6-hydroxymethyldihydropteridine diphosphokinase
MKLRERVALLGLGSNLAFKRGVGAGSPADAVEAAMARLGGLGEVLAVSSLYVTAPVGKVLQPEFVNAAVCLRTLLEPVELLRGLMAIEREFGRDRAGMVPMGPRTLDLDILLMDDVVMRGGELTLPHPAMAERRFVLAPLAEIAPEVVHPILGKSMAVLLDELPDEGQNSRAAVRILRAGAGGFHSLGKVAV